MLIKIVLDNQIRVLNSKEAPSLDDVYQFIKKTFLPLRTYVLYYVDQDGDHIILDQQIDLENYLDSCNSKPKIYIKYSEPESSILEKSQKNKNSCIGSHIFENQEEAQVKFQTENTSAEEIRQQAVYIQNQSKYINSDEEIHNARCSVCKIQSILGVRYRCGICPSFDLCSKCEQIKRHIHPLLKIRSKDQNPLKITLQYEKGSLNWPAVHPSPQKMKYETIEERSQLIVSYLENLLGEENNENYIKFSKYSKSDTFDCLFEEYVAWLERAKQPIPMIMQWFTSFFHRKSKMENHSVI